MLSIFKCVKIDGVFQCVEMERKIVSQPTVALPAEKRNRLPVALSLLQLRFIPVLSKSLWALLTLRRV